MIRKLLLLAIATAGFICSSNAHGQHRQSDYLTATEDGAWCWFADPRAVCYQNKTYLGWVTSKGDIKIGVYDPADKSVDSFVLHKELQKDDHCVPAIHFLPDGRLIVFYSLHSGVPMYYRISKAPGDISQWEEEQKITDNLKPGNLGFTYPNPSQLKSENNRLYLFWRGANFKPAFSYSDDNGANWSKAEMLMMSEEARPYLKVTNDGVKKIHISYTDGHPRNVEFNNIYYVCYYDGALHRADGAVIKKMSELPMLVTKGDVVYDAKKHNARGWIWDVAFDEHGWPAIVYASLPEENDHRYRYAKWDGEKWQDSEICRAGKWFPQTPADKTEPEPHYSGGIVLDHNDPSVVYLSREVNGVFELEKWSTKDNGATWTSKPITANSPYDNVRPVVVRNYGQGGPRVLWMNNQDKYIHYANYHGSIMMDIAKDTFKH